MGGTSNCRVFLCCGTCKGCGYIKEVGGEGVADFALANSRSGLCACGVHSCLGRKGGALCDPSSGTLRVGATPKGPIVAQVEIERRDKALVG